MVTRTKSAAATKAQALAEAVNATLGKRGEGPVVRIASDGSYKVEYIPTGLLPMDILLQGGMPKGRFVQMHGDYSTLKSYVGYNIVAQVQKMGGTAAIIDNEHSFDSDWASSVGVDLDAVIVERPETGELAIDIMEVLIRGGVDFILVDSVAATYPQAEASKRLSGESMQPGRLAQLMSAGLRRLTAANTHTSILWINQTRQNIGITFGSNEALPGGKALPYYSSYIIAMRKTGKITRDVKFYDGEKWTPGKEQIAQKFKAEVIKSKLSKPFRDIWFQWDLTDGQIDIVSFLASQGMEHGFIHQSGNTWQFGSIKVVGRQKFLDNLAASPEDMHALESQVRGFHGLPALPPLPKKAAPKAVAPKKTVAKKTLRRK